MFEVAVYFANFQLDKRHSSATFFQLLLYLQRHRLHLGNIGGAGSLQGFFGWALVLFAIFYIVFGFTASLHLKLMKRYA